MKYFTIILICFVMISPAYTTHNRAGEITYRHIRGNIFEVTITTYTYRYSNANREYLDVSWGDGETSKVRLNTTSFQAIPNTDYLYNQYTATHAYSGAGVYEILMVDPNRNQGVKNIPNSVKTPFSIKTIMVIGNNNDAGTNSTPVLLNPPIDKAAKGHVFIHNPAAYDPDGDSISYKIIKCTGAGGETISNYSFPEASNVLKIDEKSGDLIWDTPVETGVYNIAMNIEEWRDGVRIGRIARDMQIDVYETENNPPINNPLEDICVVAGDTIDITLTSKDADRDLINLSLEGGPVNFDNAKFIIDTLNSSTYGTAKARLKWITDCADARKQPYGMVFKSEDMNNDVNLVDITYFNIKVLHPPPEELMAFPQVNQIELQWISPYCFNKRPTGYKIYRRVGSYDYQPEICEYGVPNRTGYELLDIINADSTVYIDNNLDRGLLPDHEYCYMVTAIFDDGAESIASNEACGELLIGTPPIINVSVEKHSAADGEILIKWTVPLDVDTIDDGPYRYEVLRKDPGSQSYISLTTIPTMDLTDTVYVDKRLNTLVFPYYYSIKLYYEELGEWYPVPGNEIASSQYIDIGAFDNILMLNLKKITPWLNSYYDILRKGGDGLYDTIGNTTENFYLDSNLANNKEYTYYSIGKSNREIYGRKYSAVNISHLATGTPIDTVPPCIDKLSIEVFCDSLYNKISWKTPLENCGDDDVLFYKVYYNQFDNGEMTVIDTVLNPNNDTYIHRSSAEAPLVGCYEVTAVDSFYNESPMDRECVSNFCGSYRLPNVFSPNTSLYKAWNDGGIVEQVKMKIYNRYSQLVFTTTDPYINWDGRNEKTGKHVPTGVYYYICDVYVPTLQGINMQTLTGFIHVFSNPDLDFVNE